MMGGWDAWARVYRILEYAVLGGSLQRAREAAIGAVSSGRRILLLGDGDGRFLRAVVATVPPARFVSVDGSRAMIARARRGLDASARERVQWIQAQLPRQAEEIPAGPYDRIVTQFFLDCFSDRELEAWWSSVARRLEPGALWIVTEFRPDEQLQGWRRWRQRGLLAVLHAGFAWTTPMVHRRLPAWSRLFTEAGWERVEEWISPGGTYLSEVWRKPCTEE